MRASETESRRVDLSLRLASRFFTRRLTFPPATHEVRVRRVAVPMRDGVRLDADLFTPLGASRATMLVRSPYDIRSPVAVIFAQCFAERGFTVLHQSCRGTFGSEGTFDPMRNEAADGHDTMGWLREQPWFDGKLILSGASYLTYVQWALLQDPPPEVIAAVAMVGPHDLGRAVYRRGVLDLENMLGWSEGVAHQEEHGMFGMLWHAVTATRRLAPLFREFNRGRIDPELARDAPWFPEWVEHDETARDFWQDYDVTAGVRRTRAPTLIVAGWHDLFLEQSVEQHRILAERGVPTRLVIGPWTHLDLMGKGGVAWAEAYRWLDRVLTGRPDLTGERSVRLWVGGAREWRELDGWPAPEARPWYLAAGHILTPDRPAGTDAAGFTYRPDDPTPGVGGAVMSAGAGERDNRAVERRADVLTFTSDVLADPVTVMGNVRVELDVERDNPWADLFVRLCDVDPSGRSRNVCDGIVRLTDRDPLSGVAEVSLVAAAHRFGPGHRVRLIVAGGAFPRFSPNPGSGRRIDLPKAHRPVRWAVRLDGRSTLFLPGAA